MANIDFTQRTARLRSVLEWIKNNPERWDQTWWGQIREDVDETDVPRNRDGFPEDVPPCQTAMCFAGTTVMLHGYDLYWATSWRMTSRCIKDGAVSDISNTAQMILGLSRGDTLKLFWAGNTLDDLDNMVRWYEQYGSLIDYQMPEEF